MSNSEENGPRTPRILVLGATGYIGRNIVRALLRSPGSQVVLGVRNPDRLDAEAAACERRVGDLRDPAYRATVFDGIDVVCFAAAWSALHGRAAESRENFLSPTIAAMQSAADAGVSRILFTSAIDIANLPTSRSAAIRRDVSKVWPHLGNVVAIEDQLQTLAERGLTTVALRCGTFTGPGGTLGILPVLLPRLRARVVPTLEGGHVPMRLIDGRDVGEAFRVAALAPLRGAHRFDVALADSPTFLQLLQLLHAEFGIPLPWFSVSFGLAYRFAHFAELLSRVTPFDPLLTRSIVFLSEPAPVDHAPLRTLGFEPSHPWQASVREQVSEILRERVPSRLTDGRAPMLPAPR